MRARDPDNRSKICAISTPHNPREQHYKQTRGIGQAGVIDLQGLTERGDPDYGVDTEACLAVGIQIVRRLDGGVGAGVWVRELLAANVEGGTGEDIRGREAQAFLALGVM